MRRIIVVLFLAVIGSSLTQNLNILLTLPFSQSGDASALFNDNKPRPGFAVLDNTAYVPYNSLSTVNLPGGDVSWAADGVGTSKGGSCAVFSDNGDLYVFGGDTGDGLGSTQALILTSGSSSFTSLSPMTTARQHHRCAYDNSTRRIYVVGGEFAASFVTAAEYYSIDNDTWTNIVDYPYERAGFGLVSTNDGFLFAFGGRDFTGTPSQELVRYDIVNNIWSDASSAIINQASDFGYWYDTEVKMIGIFGGPQSSCQVVDVTNSSDPKPWALSCPSLGSTYNYSLSAVVGSNLHVINSDGTVYSSLCVLFTKCPYGCFNDGSCMGPPSSAPQVAPPVTSQQPVAAPVSSAPFSGCGQCSGDTPLCIAERGVCVGNRVVPILQCIDTLESGTKLAYFSYNRVGAPTPQVLAITSGSTNNLVTPSGNPNSNFIPGRSIFYPLASFTAQYPASTNVEWFLDGYVLDFSSSTSALACPKNVTIAVRVSNVTGNVQDFIGQLRQALADTMGIDVNQITASLSNQKRDSSVEQEISVVVSPSLEPSAPSPAVTIANFITNTTAIQQVQTQLPEVQEVIGKPLPTELSGQIVPSTSPTPTQSLVPKAVSSAISSREISSVLSLAIWPFLLTFV